MASLKELLRQLHPGKQIPIATRQGGGIGDAESLDEALAREPVDVGGRRPGEPLAPAPPIEDSFDIGRMLPFVSSNVEGGYFNDYRTSERNPLPSGRGDLYLMFQKRRPETPNGNPIGPPRAYVYQNVQREVWESLLSAASPGGTVWDVIRHGGIDGDRIS